LAREQSRSKGPDWARECGLVCGHRQRWKKVCTAVCVAWSAG